MNLQTYIQSDRGNATRLSIDLEIPISYLSQMASGNRSISPERCVSIESATKGVVTRQELRPNDWQAIWPELAKIKRKAVA